MTYTYDIHGLLTHEVKVGDSTCKVTQDEYEAACAEKGQTCWFKYRKGRNDNDPFSSGEEVSKWTKGTFRFSWFYDGVVVEVYEDDPDELLKHSISPSLSIREPERRERFTTVDPT